MSTRTIIEINHDLLRDIASRPDALAEFVKRLGSGREWAERVTPNGIRILGQRHHTETLKLEVK